MTRREEIIDIANKFYKNDEVSTFVVAAQWADRTMIDKAVKWLVRYASDYAFSIYDEDDACSVDDDRLIEDFKRAMLEE
jgi:hypothetical protein